MLSHGQDSHKARPPLPGEQANSAKWFLFDSVDVGRGPNNKDKFGHVRIPIEVLLILEGKSTSVWRLKRYLIPFYIAVRRRRIWDGVLCKFHPVVEDDILLSVKYAYKANIEAKFMFN